MLLSKMKKADLIKEVQKLQNINSTRPEQQLSESTRFNFMLLNAVEASGEIIFMTDTDGIITFVNPEFSKVYGYSKEEIVDKTSAAILNSVWGTNSEYKRIAYSEADQLSGKKEIVNKSKDGNIVIVESSSKTISDDSGQIIGSLFIQRDITERLSDKETYRKNEDLLRNITFKMHDLVCELDMDGIYKYNTPSYYKILGYTQDELINTSAFLRLHPDDTALAKSKFSKIISQNTTEEMDLRMISKSGEYLWFHTLGSLIHDDSGKALGIIVTSREITERKKIEEELSENYRQLENTINSRTLELKTTVNRLKNEIFEREQIEVDLIRSREEFKTLADNLPDIIIRYDKNGRMIYSNSNKDFSAIINEESASKINGKDEAAENLNKWEKLFYSTVQSGIVQTEEFEFNGNDEKKYYEVQTVPEFSRDNKVESVLTVIRNLTSQKKIENNIQFALAEKEILLREIHHRVKNNLQSIIYLIDMQVEDSDDRQLINTLKELQFKVKTMSIVHEQLYKSKNLSQLNFEDYLKNLLSNLYTMFQTNHNIEITYNASSELLNIETVLPCGMIINELVTNAVKYAFPDNFTRGADWKPVINIEFAKSADIYKLIIEDNGIGLSDKINWKEADTLGLKLVNIWANYQLNGEIHVDNQFGTRFEIKFQKGFLPRTQDEL